MNMDVATAVMSIHVSTDQRLMAGKMLLHKFKSQSLRFLASKIVFVFIARIKTDDIVMGLNFIVSVVFSILVIEHFAFKIKGVGIAVYSIHVKFAAEHHAKVARAIKTVFYALDVVNQGMQEKQSITVRCMDIEDLEKQAEAIRVEQIKLYESYADGVLLRDAYIEKKKALSEKLAALQDSIRTEKEEQECADELDEEIRALTKQASEKTYIGGLTKECVDAFVSMVYLYDDQTMKIEFNCEDVIRRALEKYGA